MRSHFNHIFALVTYNHVTESYHLVIHTAESVPAFGPPLPMRGEFTDFIAFRDFLLAKRKPWLLIDIVVAIQLQMIFLTVGIYRVVNCIWR